MMGQNKPEETLDELELETLESKRVMVHVWTSGVNPERPGDNVGHVSLSLGEQYISFWPKQAGSPFEPAAKDEGPGVAKAIPHELVLSYQLECDEYEGRPPEYTFCFYTLDTEKMLAKFHELKAKVSGWCLFGGWFSSGESCASFAWKVLVAGGMHKLISRLEQSVVGAQQSSAGSAKSPRMWSKRKPVASTSASSIYSSEEAFVLMFKSPDALATSLRAAKTKELSNNPMTEKIEHEGEWRPEQASAGAGMKP